MALRPGGPLLAGAPPVAARHARLGVDVLFFLNGFAYANVVPRLPALRDELGLSNTALGAAIAAMPVGALLAGLAAGPLVARFTSARVAVVTALGIAVLLPVLAWSPSWGVLAGAFAVMGAVDANMDVAMNTHGLRVQRLYGRSINTSFHALWSIGAVVGGVAGATAAGIDLNLGVHLTAIGGVLAVAALATRRVLLPGPDDPEVTDPGPAATEPRSGLRGHALTTLALLGGIVVMAGMIEDAPSSWGAAVLRDDLDTSAALAGAAFVAFQGAMTVGRLFGDRVIDRVGPRRVVRVGALAGAVAVTAGLAIGHPASVVIGFAVAGLGSASLFPVVYQAAGDLPGVPTGYGVGLMAWIARVGFLTAPPLVGAISDQSSLRVALLMMPLAGLGAAALAGVLPARLAQPERRGSSGSSSSTR